jgi:uncharacterized protein (TIGR02453 family)
MTGEAGFEGFPGGTFRFLKAIGGHNDRAWFEAHRADYDAFYVAPAMAFVAALGPRLRSISPAVAFEPKINRSLFRINRDVRFSADKRPYRDHLDLWFWHGDKRGWAAPGFFFRMFADRWMAGVGMHNFEKAQLDAYRAAVVEPRSGKSLVSAIDKVRSAGRYTIGGAARKTVPRGFDAQGPRAELLLHDSLTADFAAPVDETLQTAAFVDVCLGHFKAMWPIGKWLLAEVVDKR